MPEEIQKYTSTRQRIIAHRHSILAIIFILLALPVTIFLALNRQTFLNYADGGLILERVDVDPGEIIVDVNDPPIQMSALPYDIIGTPVYEFIAFDWSISSTNTIGTLTSTDSNISSFVPQEVGCGVLTINVSYGEGGLVSRVINITVKDGESIPICNQIELGSPISWSVDEMNILEAEKFYISVDGEIFTSKDKEVSIDTSPPNLREDGFYYTTLEATWYEKDVEMRLFLYFKYRPGTFWELYEVRTFDGTSNNKWLYYDSVDEFNQSIIHEKNSWYISPELILHSNEDSESNIVGVIHFEGLKLTSFFDFVPEPAVLSFESIKLHGIAQGGDNVSASASGNPSPLRTTRELSVQITDEAGNEYVPVAGSVDYDVSSGTFSGDVTLNEEATYNGSYIVKINSPQYLRKQLPGIINIINNEPVVIPEISLITGDVNNDNALSIDDYDVIVDCYSDLLPAKNCDDENKKLWADITDDGAVDANDYNLFLRELSVAIGD